MNANTNPRDNGKYACNMDRVCKFCGHTKGEHEAESPFAQGDLSMGFKCAGFKAAKKGA